MMLDLLIALIVGMCKAYALPHLNDITRHQSPAQLFAEHAI